MTDRTQAATAKLMVLADIKLTVGDYRLYPSTTDGKIGIMHISGRYREFDAGDFEEAIRRFTNEAA